MYKKKIKTTEIVIESKRGGRWNSRNARSDWKGNRNQINSKNSGLQKSGNRRGIGGKGRTNVMVSEEVINMNMFNVMFRNTLTETPIAKSREKRKGIPRKRRRRNPVK